MLEQFTTPLLFSYLLIICRVGAVILLLPSFSEGYITPRARLVIALGLSLAILPVINHKLPQIPSSSLMLVLVIAKEIMIGFFIGSVAKVLFSTLHTAGMIFAMQSGLASALLFDPSQGEQGSSPGVFLIMIGIVVILTADIHHVFIRGIVDSYDLFDPNDPLFIGGYSDVITKTVAGAFLAAIKIASPAIVMALIIYLGAGVVGRLMPQMQVFFVMLPIQIVIGFYMLILAVTTGLSWFMGYYTETVGNFIK